MKETSQAIAAVKRKVQLSEWQCQIQARQEQGITVDEWCMRMGISKGAYYHRLRKVREYLCQQMGVTGGIESHGTVCCSPFSFKIGSPFSSSAGTCSLIDKIPLTFSNKNIL